ncbi:hypothetical protein CC1G_01071 [Coprinopsis cinerea okayama7|uniref:DUF7582 domain-containing protein n=1 Tax=Coprinopsis cinerea (strain Okayama-7 / 130 / ATCC MYA-4618 / FGSC 9003) TaxID=240176 RepID=A8NEF1_COPC7|nr:hypothetical protein CC1G_01071 [Coprinopsis cinerea okayama7\|eukprot:XP_001833009.1 hypothetical protein CC1G_01071 [Coprinopsis cinerea okayama7\
MGNCLSADDPVSLRDLVTRPDGPPEVQMSADQIRAGLNNVASALNAKKRNITIIAVGGAVNTLLLRTRASTGDVDFFYRTKTKHEDVSQVIVAANTAASSLKLGDHWLNNHTAVFIEEGTIQQLYDEAVQQNDVVFQAAGLTVYAAPWRYALGTKLDRLSKTGARPYDMSDAVGYLVQLIQKRKGAAVKKSEIKKWAQDFKFTVPNDKLVDQLAAEYKKKTGKDGVING